MSTFMTTSAEKTPGSKPTRRFGPGEHGRNAIAWRSLPALLALLLALPAAASGPDGAKVEVWSRKPGNHSVSRHLKHNNSRRIELSSSKELKEKVLLDLQYGMKREYKGVSLKSLIRSAPIPADHDLALLHFRNGMIIPVSVDEDVLDRLDAFVAIDWRPTPNPEDGWQGSFPQVTREKGVTMDPRPVIFAKNKLVVEKAWHPYVKQPEEGAAGFSPWKHADTLTGIELVNRRMYFGQFTPPKKKKDSDVAQLNKGQTTFLRSCQYCHSLRDVGARFGGDFLVPFALPEVKKAEELYQHVTIQKMNSLERGLMMPTQESMSHEEIDALWHWLEAHSHSRRISPYKLPNK
jgi:mono/diheme cytochrome c family protein